MRRHSKLILSLAVCLPLMAGCDLVYEALDIPNPSREDEQAAKAEREARAIGGGCRHAGRSLEDCYTLNPDASKALIFEGWRDMNDYMTMNDLDEVPSRLPHPNLQHSSLADTSGADDDSTTTVPEPTFSPQ